MLSIEQALEAAFTRRGGDISRLRVSGFIGVWLLGEPAFSHAEMRRVIWEDWEDVFETRERIV